MTPKIAVGSSRVTSERARLSWRLLIVGIRETWRKRDWFGKSFARLQLAPADFSLAAVRSVIHAARCVRMIARGKNECASDNRKFMLIGHSLLSLRMYTYDQIDFFMIINDVEYSMTPETPEFFKLHFYEADVLH